MKKGLIVTGGSIEWGFAGDFLKGRSFDGVIAVDGGLEAVKRLGVRPDYVVGDFDTVRKETLGEYESMAGVVIERHQAEKNETDTELAIRLAMERGFQELVILGGTGGRLDHLIANVQLLYGCLTRGVAACMVDEKNRLYLLNRGRSFQKRELWGKYISFLPLTSEVRKITLTGFLYPLKERDIPMGMSLCISNELEAETGTIEFTEGVLICVESHD